MPRKKNTQLAPPKDKDLVEEIPLFNSSQETNSEDMAQELIAALEEKMRTKQNQKRRDAERKYLQDIKHELDKSYNSSTRTLQTLVARRKQVLDQFLLDHASCNDTIRKIRCQMIEEQKTLVNMIVKDKQELDIFLKESEDMQLRALAKVERACRDDYDQALAGLALKD